MKLFINAAVRVLTAVVMVFLATNANANDSQPYDCNVTIIAQHQADLANTSGKKPLATAADQVSQFLEACSSAVAAPAAQSNQIEAFYGLVDQLLQTQLKIHQTRQCIQLGTAKTDAWNSPYKLLKGSAIYTSVQHSLASCKAKRDKEIAEKFTAEKCPLFGPNHKYSSAIAVPDSWKWKTKGATCLYLYGGKNRSKPEEEGIRLRENSPHLIVLQMDGENLLEQYIDFSQGELATKELCLSGRIDGVDLLAAGGKAKNPLLRIKSYTEHCLRDSASFALDSVYQLDSEKGLVAVDELLVTLHH